MFLSQSPIFGILLTLFVAFFVLKLKNKIDKTWFNYMAMSIIVIISVLLLLDIPYKDYAKGGDIILSILGPITVILAVPLYKHHHSLMKNILPIFVGVVVGSLTSVASVYLLSTLFGLDATLMHSFLVKSVTTPIAISSSYLVGGILSLSILSVVFSGVFGALFGSALFKQLGIKNSIALGMGFGVSAHAIGTARAFELGELEGSMAALSIVLSGICTIFWLYLFF